ncbi:lipooligosaccharide transport system permease protein [Syntrophus gentianae]|uniref:Transport permease protein n=1 Tax=Syntrophus gentianae TaxID=43775 RepID=A0A1H7YQ50_9BACT|nr:ABC transporter permease [Syntrophus gentianae]SEM48083.1 lipooligosaccharide transport system permease protein [Syntrophus gentianae]
MSPFKPYDISRRFWKVWYRNLVVNRQSWKVGFLPPLLEPLFYLLAFGIGLSGLVGKISYGGSQVTYVQFIAPALLAINIMNNAFFENTYSSYVRMYYQKTFDAMMATPLTLEEIITGEIFWGATKSFLATLVMLAVISLFGLVSYPAGLLILPLSFLGGIAFGSLGMIFTGKVKTIDLFNLPIFLLITPMYLFSGTFFPLENLPSWARFVAYALPLTHLVNMVRSLGFGRFDVSLLWGLLYLTLFCLILFPMALASMHRRLIQ